jgi:hypothetical protein
MRAGTRFAPWKNTMHAVEPARWDDLVLAILLILISVPRALLSVLYERPIGAEGALSMICVALGLLILVRRNVGSRGTTARGA